MTEILSLYQFLQKFPNEQTSRKYFENKRWGNTPVCPNCGSENVLEVQSNKMSHWCRTCRKHFSVRIGTILQTSKLPLHKWLMCIYLLTTSRKGISSVQMSKTLGVTQKTSWFLCQRIREVWMNPDSSDFKLFEEVEIDETYIGGKEKNKRKSQKRGWGRGPSGKLIVVGGRQRNGKIVVKHVQGTSREILHGFIHQNVSKGSTVYTDTLKSYKGLEGYEHLTINHSVKEFVKGMIHTNGIESFWSVLKRGYYGIYHYMSPKHLTRYIHEFSFRQNTSKDGTMNIIGETISRMIGKRLSYKDLIRVS